MTLPISPAALISCGFLAVTMRPPPSVSKFLSGFLRRISNRMEDAAAEWVAKVIWYVLALIVWYAVGHLSLV
jgi:hypothetical protein